MNKERIYQADIVRIIACLMVVLMHSPMPGANLIPAFTSGLTYFCMPCIGLFLTLSGYLLLPVKTPPSESLSFSLGRVKKFLWPTLIWTFVYLCVNGSFISSDSGDIVRKICSIPFTPQEGVLWYMYVLIGLYFVAPIISPWLQQTNRRTLQIYLLIWCVSLLIPYLSPFVDIREDATSILYYFSGYLGYLVLGYYIRSYDIKISPFVSILGILGCMGLYATYKAFLDDTIICFDGGFWYLSIDSPLLVVLWWNIIRPLSDKVQVRSNVIKKNIVAFSNLSFGVYMGHILIMRYVLWNIPWILSIPNYIIQTLTVFLLTVFVTVLLVYALSLTPIGNYIVAYKK